MIGKEEISANVSRETFLKLEVYSKLLKKWNSKINLVAKSTIDTLWTRHIYDSVQIFDLIDKTTKKWTDIGSGGGFPGLVLAIMANDLLVQPAITLVESDKRKAVFLRTVLRETNVSATVLTTRIEQTPALGADIMTARALADLKTLLQFTQLHQSEGGVSIFPKGANWKKEVIEARKIWHFDCDVVKSKTDDDAVILKIQGLTNV